MRVRFPPVSVRAQQHERFLDAAYVSSVAASVQDNALPNDGHFLRAQPGANGFRIPTTVHLSDARARLAAAGATSLDTSVPQDVPAFIAKFLGGVPTRLQSTLMSAVHKQTFAEVQQLSAHDPRWAARLRSASAPGAHYWLTALPTTDQTMRDPHYQLAVRLLIGIPPSAHRPPPCSLCGARADLQSDPWHPLHCRFQASHGKSVQHNEVRDLLWNLCRKAGYANVRTEVKDYQATCHSIPDVVVTFDCTTHAIDVSGIDPCAPSHVAQSARHTLSSAHEREVQKNAQHALLSQRHDVSVVPFVFETHGGLGPRAIEFIDKLVLHDRGRAYEDSRKSFRHTILSAISVTIQRCNAAMVYDAYQLCQGRASANRANATGRVLPPAGRRDH